MNNTCTTAEDVLPSIEETALLFSIQCPNILVSVDGNKATQPKPVRRQRYLTTNPILRLAPWFTQYRRRVDISVAFHTMRL
jgi:hypothetical protein